MEDELIYIDLIDKYLNDTLSPVEYIQFRELRRKEPAFEKELQVYTKIYAEIASVYKDEFKDKLDTYYEVYKAEVGNPANNRQSQTEDLSGGLENEAEVQHSFVPSTTQKNETNKIGNQRILIIISSIAASLIFGYFAFYNNYFLPERDDFSSNQSPEDGKIDPDFENPTNRDGKTMEDLTKDDQNKYDKDEMPPILSIGTLESLPKTSVRHASYPSEMYYKFDGDLLTIYGDPLLAALQLHVYEAADDQLYLKYKNDHYQIKLSDKQVLLKKTSIELKQGNKTRASIFIKVENITQSSQIYGNQLSVLVTQNIVAQSTYLFQKKEEQVQIILDGKFSLDILSAYVIEQGDSINYFLKYGKGIFQLDSKNQEATQLSEINIITNNTTRLFREREIVKKDIYASKL